MLLSRVVFGSIWAANLHLLVDFLYFVVDYLELVPWLNFVEVLVNFER